MTIDIADLADAGISSAQLVTSADGHDTLTLTVDGPINSTPIIAPFEQVTLMDGSDQRFVGWCDQAPRADAGGGSSHSYVISGPMRWLNRVFMLDLTRGGLVQLSATLLADPSTLGALDTTIRDILDRVVTATSGAIGYVDADLDIDGLQHHIAPETRHDSWCGDALIRALRYAPTVAFWWEYPASLPPRIRFADTNKTDADEELSESVYDLSQASLNPRYDMLHDQVEIYWLVDGVWSRTDATSSSGDAHDLGANRKFIQTFDAGIYNVPPAGIAPALLAFYSRLHIDATATQIGLDWTLHPGELWSFAGILAGSYKSVCHQITRDLFQQTQSLALGIPPAMGIYSLSEGNSGSSGLPKKETPTGSAGEMLYHNGTDWVSLANPGTLSPPPVLRHDGTAPYWEQPGC